MIFNRSRKGIGAEKKFFLFLVLLVFLCIGVWNKGAEAAAGDLYVGSVYSNQVLLYNGTTGASLGVFASGGGLVSPMGLAFGPDGNLYVSSRGVTHQVLRYDGTTGAFIDVFASGGLFAPTGLVFGPDGNLYVSSYSSDQVLRYDGTTGASMGAFVAAGSGGLDVPFGLVFGPGGDLYVSSAFSDQVLRYNGTTGASLGVFASGEGPQGLVFGPDGNLYVSSYGTTSNQVLRYNGATGASMGAFVAAGSGGLNGPAFLVFKSGASPDPIPTMNEWGMIIFMVLAGLIAMDYMRRKERG